MRMRRSSSSVSSALLMRRNRAGGGEELTASYTAEEAQKSVRGMEENAVHSKYIELVGAAFITTMPLLNLVYSLLN